MPVSDHGKKVEAEYPDFLPTTPTKRGGGLGTVEGRRLSVNKFEFARFMTGRPTAAAGAAGSYCCACYPYVMRVVARVVVLLSLFIVLPATLLTAVQFGFGFVCDHYTENRGMFEAIVTCEPRPAHSPAAAAHANTRVPRRRAQSPTPTTLLASPLRRAKTRPGSTRATRCIPSTRRPTRTTSAARSTSWASSCCSWPSS